MSEKDESADDVRHGLQKLFADMYQKHSDAEMLAGLMAFLADV